MQGEIVVSISLTAQTQPYENNTKRCHSSFRLDTLEVIKCYHQFQKQNIDLISVGAYSDEGIGSWRPTETF